MFSPLRFCVTKIFRSCRVTNFLVFFVKGSSWGAWSTDHIEWGPARKKYIIVFPKGVLGPCAPGALTPHGFFHKKKSRVDIYEKNPRLF